MRRKHTYTHTLLLVCDTTQTSTRYRFRKGRLNDINIVNGVGFFLSADKRRREIGLSCADYL